MWVGGVQLNQNNHSIKPNIVGFRWVVFRKYWVANKKPQRFRPKRLYTSLLNDAVFIPQPASGIRILPEKNREKNRERSSITKGGRKREERGKRERERERVSCRKLGKAMASWFTKWLVDPKKNWFAKQHMKSVSTRLRRYGLRYDDLYDPYYDLDIKEALNRLPREVIDARNQRLKRAMDLSMKHEYLPEDVQAMQTPFRSYLQDMLALVKRENAEREALGALPLYQRTIP
ncbi:hypothetical protein RHMOL_Rhmol02G0245700 [Rhododendron molle]|uniref:Uncharacterized protein n=2 Tax=Rhododendron molle TaxID=49168 RepID=A0ACC0PV36_RHOML|nr:hypothetical protein RHMOL_Rhmol02G0245700 [Rhododendron molle]KAI8569010.1 hypothetical protein RHMOL_Rhmol02G0245700 [Rhododendron molle]